MVNCTASEKSGETTRSDTRIIGIVLVKNEDVFIRQVLLNVLDFCDEILVADNMSCDGTADIVKKLSQTYPAIRYRLVQQIKESHELIREYAGQNVWVFGVDGDELYDPEGLRSMRKKLLAGQFNDWWVIFGNVLHCTAYNDNTQEAKGYLAPPCRSMTKLYNFQMIKSWHTSSGERLHGGEIVFKPGYGKDRRYSLFEEVSWEESPFRCLHMCFVQRSSQQPSWKGNYLPRPNPADLLGQTRFRRVVGWVWQKMGLPVQGKQEWKQEKFTRGQHVRRDASQFFAKDSVK